MWSRIRNSVVCEVEYPYFKIYLDKNISLKHIWSVLVWAICWWLSATLHGIFTCIYLQLLTGVDPPGDPCKGTRSGDPCLFGSILLHCNLPTGILPWGFVSSGQHVRGSFHLNQAFCLVLFFCKVTDRYFPLQISLVLKYSCKSRTCAMVLYNNCFIKNVLIFVNCFIFSWECPSYKISPSGWGFILFLTYITLWREARGIPAFSN